MPEARYYTVTQEREVKIVANSPIEAAQIASSFLNDKTSDIPAQILSPIKERELRVREDYV